MQGVATATGVKGTMVRSAIAVKLRNYRETRSVGHTVWDKLVFRNIKVALGLDRVRLMLSGGAPLPVATMEV
jgi:long-chain acyl-CoA synthetase